MNVYLISHPIERPDAAALAAALQARGLTVHWEAQITTGMSWEEWDAAARRDSALSVGLLTPDYGDRTMFDYRIAKALQSEAPFVPVLRGGWGEPSAALADRAPVRWPRGGDVDAVAAEILAAAG